MHFNRVDDADNLLEMNDIEITQLGSLHTQYFFCTCEKTGNQPIIEAVCSREKAIVCDIYPTKALQKNTCQAKRRRFLQERLSYIPNNYVQHQNREKASKEIKEKDI